MINLGEIIIANGIAFLMMIFLLDCRRQNRKRVQTEDKIFNLMAIIVLVEAVIEIISFVVDAKPVAGGRIMNYASNSLSFVGTVSIGVLWCLYVDLHVHRSYQKTLRSIKFVMIPWAVEVIALIYNAFGTNFMFMVSQDNVYQRGPCVVIGYVTLLIYFVYSILLVYSSKRQVFRLDFFPVHYFIGPCLAGVIVQGIFYGISTSWISVAIAMIFVQMKADSENLMTDAFSGLYNRRYLSEIFAKRDIANSKSLYGIMMDINDLKKINDKLGHSEGDHAIRTLSDIIFSSVPEGAMPIRYAGDEFVILMSDVSQEQVDKTMEAIDRNIQKFNESESAPFVLSAAMGQARLGSDANVETFLADMDANMYIEKRKYHLAKDEGDIR